MNDVNDETDATVEKKTFYAMLGEAVGVRGLVDHFYDEMDTNVACAVIRAMHPADLSSSREKLYLFLSGWLGGPPLYVQKHGHPRLRARHMPFAIDPSARDQWMLCMHAALRASALDDEHREKLSVGFANLADHMVNV